MKLTIKILNDLPKRFLPLMDSIFKRALLYHMEELQNQVKLNLSGRILRKRTGRLLQAWSSQPRIETHGGWGMHQHVAKLAVNSKYARIHEGPDNLAETFTEVRPVRAKCLRFIPEGSSHFICVPMVRIPARRYVTRSFEIVKKKSAQLSRIAIRDVVREEKR